LKHPFILQPGVWLGEGRISFTESPEELRFYTRWTVSGKEEGVVSCVQEIEVEGVSDPMQNNFSFCDILPDSFLVRLENSVLGTVDGEGIIDSHLISWEFRQGMDAGFEGFEIYEVQSDETYKMHAEYASAEQFRTAINGRLWLQTAGSTRATG